MGNNVVAYCRVSTDKEDQINSFIAQQEFFKKYAEQHNLNLIRIYADEGITGTSRKNRKEFNSMMKDSEKGLFQCVLVKDVSRLARNTVDFLQSIRRLKALNINVRFITANMETQECNEFTLTVLAAMAQEESANMSKRVKFGKKVNAEKGRVPNQCFGYIKTNGDYFHLQVNQEEAKIIRGIFDMYVNQGYGSHKIAKHLNDLGLTSARGVPWSTTAVSRLLKNKIYAGYIVNGKSEITDFIEKTRKQKDQSEWIEIERPELRIIPLEVWEQAQQINQKNNSELTSTLHKKRSNQHLFSTLITCPECGYSFRRFTRKNAGGVRIWWACSGRNHYGTNSCKNKITIPENELIENIDNYFHTLTVDREKFITALMGQYQKQQMPDAGQALQDQLKTLQIKREKQIAMFEAEIISLSELKKRTTAIDKQIAQMKLELSQYGTPENNEAKMKKLYDLLVNHLEKYTSVENMTNAELKTLISEIIPYPDGRIKIKLNDN